jgi:UDP-3-O-[3-hydroxymyristoyl] glucosamine N-acyltransferase
LKLSSIAKLLKGELTGDAEKEINNVGKIENASPDEITFFSNPLYEKYVLTTNAGAVIVSKDFRIPDVINRDNKIISFIKVDDPYISFLKILEHFSPKIKLQKPGIHKTAVISNSATISKKQTSIGANCYVGEKCRIGKKTKILPNCVIMNNVEIGNNVLIYPNVTIYSGCKIGYNVIIHSGSVIGSDGFGQARKSDGTYSKIPQNGIVVIEDDVEIGSNCTIDRATMGETKLCRGVKLDNQIQIAHNVCIGENTVIAAQVGIAGSTKIGKSCLIGGKAGIVGHIEICDEVIITAATNVSKSITKAGIYSGYRGIEQ